MTDVNPITGDRLMSKPSTKNYEDGYDRIFKKKVDLHTTKEDEKRPPERKAQHWEHGSKQEEEGCEAPACKGD